MRQKDRRMRSFFARVSLGFRSRIGLADGWREIPCSCTAGQHRQAAQRERKALIATPIVPAHITTRGTAIATLLIPQADRLRLSSSPIKEGRIMNKATITLVAAVAALSLSGGASAQAAGGANAGGSTGTAGSTASPSNQMNGSTSGGYGMPGSTNSDSGMGAKAPNSGLPSMNSSSPSDTAPAPKTNNTLATPSVVSPAATGH
jgi:hypothetical protein